MTASGWTEADRRFMRQAIALARRHPDRVSPNPRVGAVVVRGGRVVGRGFHRGPGTEHGEAAALRRAGPKSRGATLYVNLEPCAHWGRTPPCADAVVASGVKRVVYANADPDARVKGRGARIIARAGIRVERGLLDDEAAELNRAYLHWKTTGRPWITLKLAMTLDGRTSDASGRSRWITGGTARHIVHHMRREADLVMVGRRTVERDDPRLDVRLPDADPATHPLRLVVDSRLRADPSLRFFDRAGAARTLVATTRRAPASRLRALESRGIRVLRVRATRAGRVDLGALFEALGAMEVTRVLVEGGAEVAASLLAGPLVDEVAVFHAPLMMGGARDLARAVRLEPVAWGRVGVDALMVGRPGPGSARRAASGSR